MSKPSNPLANFFASRAGAHLGRMQYEAPKKPALPSVIQELLNLPLEHFKAQALRDAEKAITGTPLTNVAFVLDKSGSMKHGKEVTIEGFNSQVDVVRKGAKDAGKTQFTEVHFGDEVEIRRVAAGVESMTKLDNESYSPDGSTALYDALGDTIAALLQTAGINEAATATLVTLFTDGGENCSWRYAPHELSELIKRLEATGRWTFALVGPRNSVTALADLLAVSKSNVRGYDPASVQERAGAFAAMASASTSYMSMRSVGATQVMGLYAGQDDQV